MPDISTENIQTQLKNDFSSPKPSLSPQLKIQPASDWAGNTLTALDSTDPSNQAVTPGPELPGAYPYTPSTTEPGPSLEEVKETAREYFNAASQYVPSQDEIKKMAQNASVIVTGYIPNGVAAYLGAPLPQQEATKASPIEESETTPTTGGTFVLINRGNQTNGAQARGGHDAEHESNDRSERTNPEPSRTSNTLGIPSHHSQTESPSEDASIRTQPGSLAASERQFGVRGDVTPYSYTAASTTTPSNGNSRRQAVDTDDTLLQGHANPMSSTPPEMRGHPEGVVNHDGVNGAQADHGALLEPTSRKGVPEKGGSGKVRRSMDDEKRAERLREGPEVGKMGNGVNTKPRTHPLGAENATWKGVPLEEKYQAALDRDEDRGLRIGENKGSTIISGAKAGFIPRASPPGKPAMEHVYSNTATTGHERVSSGGTTGSSRFREEPLSDKQENISQDEITTGPRPTSPMSSSVNPHVGKATSGPNAAKLGESTEHSPGRHSRRRSGFMGRIKAWSKRLSQDKKQ